MKLYSVIIAIITCISLPQKLYTMSVVRVIKSCLKKSTSKQAEPTADQAASQETPKEIAKPAPAKRVWISRYKAQVHPIEKYKHPKNYDSSDDEEDVDSDKSSGSDSDSDTDPEGRARNTFRNFITNTIESIQKLEASNNYAKLSQAEATRGILKDLKLDDNGYFKTFGVPFQSRFKWALEKTITKWLAHQESIKHDKTKAQINLRLVFLSFMQ